MQLPVLAWSLMPAALLIIGAGLLTGLGGIWLLRRLPEPVPADGADTATQTEYAAKIAYATIADRRFALIIGVCAAVGAGIGVITQPAVFWLGWAIYGCAAVLLAGIDARTTWLPTAVVYGGWLALAIGLTVGIALLPDNRGLVMITVAAGAVIAGVGYFLLWALTRGRGVAFGDVRLMPMVGAVAGTMSWSGIYWTVLLGSVVGALIGVVRLIRGLRGPFPYAPALVSGPYAAAVLLAVS